MKRNNITIQTIAAGKLAVLILFVLSFTSCEEGPDFRKFNYPEQTVTGMSPGMAFPTQRITITGADFGTETEPVKVYFNGVLADSVLSCTDNQIIVKVPDDAISGKITLTIWTHTIDSIGNFIVMPLPTLESVISKGGIAPNIAMPGDEVWITGKNFFTDESNVTIDFNGTPVTDIVSLSETLIKVIAPEDYTTGPVHITFNDLTLTGTALAPGITPGDVSVLFLKNYQQPFTYNLADAQKGTKINWATPADWTINSAAQNQLNSGATQLCGGLNYGKTTAGEIVMQAGWGGSNTAGNSMTNGKMYQTINLPAGTYHLVATVKESGTNSGSDMYMAAVLGSEMPNTADIPASALSYVEFTESQSYTATPLIKTITFTLTQNSTVSVGFVGTMVSNAWIRLNSMTLVLE